MIYGIGIPEHVEVIISTCSIEVAFDNVWHGFDGCYCKKNLQELISTCLKHAQDELEF